MLAQLKTLFSRPNIKLGQAVSSQPVERSDFDDLHKQFKGLESQVADLAESLADIKASLETVAGTQRKADATQFPPELTDLSKDVGRLEGLLRERYA